jgi:hypothetical protein
VNSERVNREPAGVNGEQRNETGVHSSQRAIDLEKGGRL